MRPVRIEGADPQPLGAPPDWDADRDGHCSALFVRREVVEGIAFMRSAYEVDDHDAMLMYAGARLTLGVSGSKHPVVQLGTEGLPADFEPVLHARRFTSAQGWPMVRVEMLYPNGGAQRVFSVVRIDGTYADAVSIGIGKIEEFARSKGWID